ncbi:MAG TPA: hypothetical protein VFM18_22375 [Methanosarcina sp.]|nr:hypothetical protein [Methanosarcina sp.]
MKDLKALKILKNCLVDVDLDINGYNKCAEIYEAIAELEALQAKHNHEKEELGILLGKQNNKISEVFDELKALQAPKKCDGCKWEKSEEAIMRTCSKCSRLRNDYYEPKETPC